MGQWRSETFKEYISDQLNSFYKGMLTEIKRRLNFFYIKGGAIRKTTKEMRIATSA